METYFVQNFLRVHGFYSRPAMGIADAETDDALRAFQADRGLPVTGEVDAATEAALRGTVSDLPGPAPKYDRVADLVDGSGPKIRRIVVHSTGTREGYGLDVSAVDRWHRVRGLAGLDYNFLIRLDGRIEKGAAESAHGDAVAGVKSGALSIAFVGGLNSAGDPADTRTEDQRAAMVDLLSELTGRYPDAKVIGHRDLKMGDTDCPGFDVAKWWAEIQQ